MESFHGSGSGDANYLILRGNSGPVVQEWSGSSIAYLRKGIRLTKLVPAEEFDALLYVDKVGPPDYKIR